LDGRRSALIIASDNYEHPGLRRLRAPAADAQALAEVLGDREIGGFEVKIVHNEPAHVVEGDIEDLFAESQSDDLVLLHFSGHGLKSDSGELFFATTNTRPDRLASTAVPADFVQRCMRTARARSIVLFLDCCYGGAFGEGVAVRAAGSANVLESFPAGRLGGGRGRAVITASSAMEYAFEGNSLADEHQQQPSVFTSALVEGLASGEADRDEDGLVSLNELYDYVFDRVRERNPKQTPGRDVELQGELYLARSHRRRVRALPIPGDVAAALKDDNPFTRLGAVAELRNRLASTDLGAALGAHEALVEVARADITYVATAASEALAATRLKVVPPQLDLGELAQGGDESRTVRLVGTPLARSVRVDQADPWLSATVSEVEVTVTVDTSQAGPLSGAVALVSPAGRVSLPVKAVVVPAPQPVEVTPPPAPVAEVTPPSAQAEAPSPLVPQASPVVPETKVAPAPEPVAQTAAVVSAPLADVTAGVPEPAQDLDELPSPEARTSRTAPRGTPEEHAPAPRVTQRERLPGIATLLSGALMLLSVVLPQQWGTPTYSQDPIKAMYLVVLGVVVLAVGGLALAPWRRIWGLGAAIGCSAVGTWVAVDMINTLAYIGFSGLDIGFWTAFASPLVLIAAGGMALMAARQRYGLELAALRSAGWACWLVIGLGVVGAVVLLSAALLIYSASGLGTGMQWLWLTALAVGVPVMAVLVRPVDLGRSMVVGWALACVAPVLAVWAWFEDKYDSSSHGMWLVVVTLAGMAGLGPFIHRTGKASSQPGSSASGAT
jgi:Caspase domain